MKLPISDILDDIQNTIGSKQKLDAALVVLKLTDYRTSIEEAFAIKTISKMIDNAKPDNTFMILTHCDLVKPSEEFIQGKLDSFKEYGPLEIQPDNVIQFDNTTKSLEPFISKLKPSDMHFHEKLVEKAVEIMDVIPEDLKRQDDAEGTQNHEQFKMFAEMQKVMKQNEELLKRLNE